MVIVYHSIPFQVGWCLFGLMFISQFCRSISLYFSLGNTFSCEN